MTESPYGEWDRISQFCPDGGWPLRAYDHPTNGTAGYLIRMPDGQVLWTDGNGKVQEINS